MEFDRVPRLSTDIHRNVNTRFTRGELVLTFFNTNFLKSFKGLGGGAMFNMVVVKGRDVLFSPEGRAHPKGGKISIPKIKPLFT